MPVIVPAYAKLNLTLDVLGGRDDGYHEIASVMQTVSLHDVLLVERSDCRIFEMSGKAIHGENLVLKAARELEAFVGRALPLRILLHKRIPIGAGLAGGSADAAALLRVAPQLYGLTIAAVDMQVIAAAVGQDIPFLLRGGTALATGTGSTVEPLPSLHRSARFLIVCPPVEVSTSVVYQGSPVAGSSGARTAALVAALRAGRRLDATAYGNDLEAVTASRFPAVARAIAPIRAGLPGLRMSGTGAAFFAPVQGGKETEAALEACARAGLPAWICHPVPAWA